MIKVRLHCEIVLSIDKNVKGSLRLGLLKSIVEACECLYLVFLLLMTFFYCQRRHCDQSFGISIISVLPLFMQGEFNTHHAVLVNGI
jgi:hypothetical protein